MVNAMTPQQDSLLECMKKFDVRGVMDHLRELNCNLMEIVTFFAIGMLTGFLCKRYFKSALLWTFIGVVTVVILDYFGIVMIQWDVIQSAVGTSPTEAFDTLFQQAAVWVRDNVPVVISFVIGFTVGVRVG